MNVRAARKAAMAFLAERQEGKTVCPSEIARAMTQGHNWRDAMPQVHEAIDALLVEGSVQLSWKGEIMTERSGPYRIGRPD